MKDYILSVRVTVQSWRPSKLPIMEFGASADNVENAKLLANKEIKQYMLGMFSLMPDRYTIEYLEVKCR